MICEYIQKSNIQNKEKYSDMDNSTELTLRISLSLYRIQIKFPSITENLS